MLFFVLNSRLRQSPHSVSILQPWIIGEHFLSHFRTFFLNFCPNGPYKTCGVQVCRDNSFVSGGIQNLPRVISLEHIIERVRHPSPPASAADAAAAAAAESDDECCGDDDIACQLCDDGTRLPRRAVKSCLHCNASYCTTCLRVRVSCIAI